MKKQTKAIHSNSGTELFKNDPNSLIVDATKLDKKSVETEDSTQLVQGFENTQYPSQKQGQPHYIQNRQSKAFDPLKQIDEARMKKAADAREQEKLKLAELYHKNFQSLQ